jgi:hypothetical protein
MSVEEADFYDLTDAVIEQLLPRLPKWFLDVYEAYADAGEYWYLVEGLAWTLVDAQVPVSAQERDQIYQLVNHLKGNEEMLAKLGGLTVDRELGQARADGDQASGR